MTDMQGWDEFSAYSWLNSPNGKRSINWPMHKQVPMDVVRQYIANSDNGPRMEPKPQPQIPWDQAVIKTIGEPKLTPVQEALTAVVEALDGADLEAYRDAAEMLGEDKTTHEVLTTIVTLALASAKQALTDEDDDQLLDSLHGLATEAIMLYAYWLDQING